MSKKRSNKSKRRRDSSGGTDQPRLVLVSNSSPAGQEPADVTDATEGSAAVALARDTRDTDSGMPPARSSGEELDDEAFFSSERVPTPHTFALDDLLEPEVRKPSPKMSATAKARRQRFSRYVKGAMVAGCAILALAGVRMVVGHADRVPENFAPVALAEAPRPSPPAPTPAQTVATTAAQAPLVAENVPPPPAPAVEAPPETAKAAEPAAAVPVVPAKADEPAKQEPKAEAKGDVKPEPTKAEAKAEPTPVEPGTVDPKAAASAKVEARGLLERGKATLAIEAGERSVALDPSDGEAWLILGAAYQEKGNQKDARRAFQSCSKLGKRGPMAECRAMLQ